MISSQTTTLYRAGITAMLKDMPKITVTSSLNSSTTFAQTITPTVPVGVNPFIHIESLPSQLVFIIVGAVLALIFFTLFLFRFMMWYSSSRAAKSSAPFTETQELDYDPQAFQKKHMATHSIYSLGGSMSRISVLGSQSLDDLSIGMEGQGRSYRNAVTKASRSSMFISPTTQLLALGGLDTKDSGSASYLNFDNSPIESPQTVYTQSTYDVELDRERAALRNKHRRPPSVHMEKMFDDDLTTDASSTETSYDRAADEKV